MPTPIVVETVFFNRQSIPFHLDSEPVKFKGITDVSFHFTAPTFLSPEKIKFKYRLEGFEKRIVLHDGVRRRPETNEKKMPTN